MKSIPKKLKSKLEKRKFNNSFRALSSTNSAIDFFSNDYLGFSKSKSVFDSAYQLLQGKQIIENGSAGSRLLAGNHILYDQAESLLKEYHACDSALIFNSGYDANIGLFSSVPQRGDIILYDEYIHASIRDGISISNANAHKFRHNDLQDLHSKLKSLKINGSIYIVTESVFSMDGDSPDFIRLTEISELFKAFLIVDEAHAVGVCGDSGSGIIQKLNLEEKIFARIVTFGKALGCHGSAILSSKNLREYLINYARSFIYTTALPPHSLATIISAYKELSTTGAILKLHKNIDFFKAELKSKRLTSKFIQSNSAIQSCIIRGNTEVKAVARELNNSGYNVKPILYPSVAEGHERLRFCIHAYNKPKEIREVLTILSNFVGQKMSVIDE